MKKVRLGKDLEISPIVTGLWQIADIERKNGLLDPHRTSLEMEPYVENGLTSFDMADHYGSSEIIAGTFRASNVLGREVQLFTKWVPKPGKISRLDVKIAVDLALDRMKSSSIDLMQFHAWNYSDSSWLDGLFYLQELQEKGLIKHLGVTNFDTAHLRIALSSGIPIVSNQICHSLLDQRASNRMVVLCKEYLVKILAFGTLAGGFLTDKWLGREEPESSDLETWSQMKYFRFIQEAGGWSAYQNLLHAVKAVADRHLVSIANVATKYILDKDYVASVIIGARLGKSDHIEDNLKTLELQLSQEDRQCIESAQEALSSIPGDCGDEYRKPPFLTASGDLSHHLEGFPLPYEPKVISKTRAQVFSGTEWEEYAGYCRAVRDGNRIHVSGTTATHGLKLIGGNDPAAQTHFIIDKIEGAIISLGGKLEDVVRTRIFINKMDIWEPVARAHGERFKEINPANTLVKAELVGDGYLVEIEAEAVVEE